MLDRASKTVFSVEGDMGMEEAKRERKRESVRSGRREERLKKHGEDRMRRVR